MGTDYVLCEVKTEFLFVFEINISLRKFSLNLIYLPPWRFIKLSYVYMHFQLDQNSLIETQRRNCYSSDHEKATLCSHSTVNTNTRTTSTSQAKIH